MITRKFEAESSNFPHKKMKFGDLPVGTAFVYSTSPSYTGEIKELSDKNVYIKTNATNAISIGENTLRYVSFNLSNEFYFFVYDVDIVLKNLRKLEEYLFKE
jgi:hypothetical protein